MPEHNSKFKTTLSYSNRAIASLLIQVDRQKKLLEIIRTALPESLAIQVQSCVIKDRKLLLYTDSAVWASQLRFYSRAIEEIIRSRYGDTIDMTKVRIIASTKAPGYEPLAPNIPSSENIVLIRENIKNVSDNQLKTSLLRLTKTLEKFYDAAASD